MGRRCECEECRDELDGSSYAGKLAEEETQSSATRTHRRDPNSASVHSYKGYKAEEESSGDLDLDHSSGRAKRERAGRASRQDPPHPRSAIFSLSAFA
jgi:hypothetical protein